VIRAAVLLLGACAAEHGPQLSSVTPAAARAGETVTITGTRLCEGDCATAGGSIVIGYDTPVVAMILDYTDTRAIVRIPTIAPAGKTVLIATVNERSSNALDFEVLPP
jgi:IPT/TIG domain